MKLGKQGNELRAGIFVLVGVLVFTAAIFLLGKKSALFTRNTDLLVEFENVSGLVVGAPVRVAGLEVGTVGAISFPEDLRAKHARVRLVVQSRFMTRIRADSGAFIDSAGLLGDKVVNISMGSPDAEVLAAGATLKAGQAVGFEALSGGLNRTVQSLVNITGAVEGIVKEDRTERLQADLSRIAASLADIYEDLKSVLGSIKRNVLFKALVRFTMESEQLRRAEEAPAIDEDQRANGSINNP